MFVFGRKFLGQVVPLGVNFSFVSGMFVFRYKFLAWVVSLTLGRVLKTQKHPRFSYGTFPVCMIACTYVCHKGRVLKTQIYLNFFLLCGFSHFLSEVHQPPFLAHPRVCMFVCIVCVWNQNLLNYKMLSLQAFNYTCSASKVKRGSSVDTAFYTH